MYHLVWIKKNLNLRKLNNGPHGLSPVVFLFKTYSKGQYLSIESWRFCSDWRSRYKLLGLNHFVFLNDSNSNKKINLNVIMENTVITKYQVWLLLGLSHVVFRRKLSNGLLVSILLHFRGNSIAVANMW